MDHAPFYSTIPFFLRIEIDKLKEEERKVVITMEGNFSMRVYFLPSIAMFWLIGYNLRGTYYHLTIKFTYVSKFSWIDIGS